MDQIVVDMVDKVFDAGQAYVAFSRVKTLEGLCIKKFKPANIRVNYDVESEMKRLSTQRLSSKLLPKVVTLPGDSWIKIAHLNVHSYLAKHVTDEVMRHVNIMCFTETFLRPQQQLGDKLPMKEDCMVFRLDRTQTSLDDLTKGGIMIACPKSLQPIRITNDTPSQLELIGITATSTHSRCIITVYRRPQQPLTTFLTLMDHLISNLPQIVPTIILGDFNDDPISTSPSLRLLHFMSSKGFT